MGRFEGYPKASLFFSNWLKLGQFAVLDPEFWTDSEQTLEVHQDFLFVV
jgi:hypothetical protein